MPAMHRSQGRGSFQTTGPLRVAGAEPGSLHGSHHARTIELSEATDSDADRHTANTAAPRSEREPSPAIGEVSADEGQDGERDLGKRWSDDREQWKSP
jgi:hypothetical protein